MGSHDERAAPLEDAAVLGVLMAILMPSTMSCRPGPAARGRVPAGADRSSRSLGNRCRRSRAVAARVNFVAKVDGETPAEMGFGDDDAQFLADNGFDVVRLG